MTLCNACIRPSGASYRDDLISLKEHKNPSKMIDDLLASTHGHLVYQEQVIAFLQQICGLSGGEADNVRRAIGRKQVDRLEAALPSILEGYCSKSDKPREVAEEEAKTFIKIIEDASSYMFGFNHATGYSMLGYLCAYYRHYYPLEFCTAFLNCAESESDFTAGTQLIKDLGYKIMPAKFGVSRSGFFFSKEDGAIYKSVDSIKELNKAVGEEMFVLRDNHYESFIDVLYDLKEKTSLRSNQLDILIKLNFFSDFGEPNKLLYLASRFDRLAMRKNIRIDQLNELNIERDDLIKFSGKQRKTRIEELDVGRLVADRNVPCEKLGNCHKPSGGWSTKRCAKLLGLDLENDPSLLPYATKIVMGSFSDIDNRGLLKYYEQTAISIPASPATRMQWEKEYLGYIEYSDPTADPRLVMVMNLDTKFSPRFTAYCLKTGETKDLKVHKKKFYRNPEIVTAFADTPFHDGDILYMKKCKLEPRQKKVGDDWIKDYTQMDWWIKDYKVV